MKQAVKRVPAKKEEESNSIAVRKVPVEGKNGLFSVVVEPTSSEVMSLSAISKILNRPLPSSEIGSNTTKSGASASTSSDR